MKLIRCDHCKKEFSEDTYANVYHVEKHGIVLASQQNEWHFDTEQCMAEYFAERVL